ncbi:hypothetical protein SAMN02745244_01299 [Tessaracoccus bendigoensis DSM 12906]|uniref:NGG1p interacting factor NIF3 n=1 Tax=Tessaracoccus bendigoensis DSM 12906 TaxID=1123357 RepID=A0A1M6EY02_9ACTN|nr:hypothetical protein [Tessaracoccus bendigoensis]SHI90290.1 hypothetical protein SAMN02745244_01299 [Tessaracoccus bendigoensis DSM 12906]
MLVLVCFVPASHAEAVRGALAGAGAGAVGAYTACSFTVPGEGRFRPGEGASPFLGEVGDLSVVHEVRIECVCPRGAARAAVEAMLAAHPYEEPAWHCYEALTLDDLT